jgi:hypothetical protein
MMPFGARASSRAVSLAAVSIAAGAVLSGCGAPGAAPGRARGSAGEDAFADAGARAPTVSPETSTATPAAGESAPPVPGVYRGTYFVPVPAELEPYALFELESVRVEVRGDELGLDYDLPELLLGERRGLSFRGSATAAGEYRLEGDDGVATCRQSAGRFRCDEALNGVELDSSKIDRLLQPLSDAEARARRGVADRFSIDPIGVLEVELSPRP